MGATRAFVRPLVDPGMSVAGRPSLPSAAGLARQQTHAGCPAADLLADSVEELTSTVEALHAVNAALIQGQQAARASQQRDQERFDGVPAADLVTNLEGLIQEANPVAAALLNLDQAQLSGLPRAS
jgi:PAS domain-containing protein